MKRFITSLSFLLCICLVLLSFPGFATADTLSDDSTAIIPTVSQDNYGIAPLHLYPFIYSEDDNFSFFREIIGPCNCIPGYLYVKNLITNEIVQLWDEPVSELVDTADFVFCITANNKIIQVDYTGTYSKVLHSSSTPLSSIIHFNTSVYFIDNYSVMRYNLSNRSIESLLHEDGITSVFPYASNLLLLESNTTKQFTFNCITGKRSAELCDHDVAALLSSSSYAIESSSPSVSPINAISTDNCTDFPLTGYEHGTYFTVDRNPCNHTSTNIYTNCQNYKGPKQCMGFAMFASEAFAHLPNTGSFQRPVGDWVSYASSYLQFQSPVAVRLFFNRLTKGAYVRLSRDSNEEDTQDMGTHSVVYVATTNTGVTLYDSNRIGDCQIAYATRTFSTIQKKYEYVCEYVSHQCTRTAQLYSYTYHRVDCSNCAGYLYLPHNFVTSNNQTVCSDCGCIQPLDGIS